MKQIARKIEHFNVLFSSRKRWKPFSIVMTFGLHAFYTHVHVFQTVWSNFSEQLQTKRTDENNFHRKYDEFSILARTNIVVKSIRPPLRSEFKTVTILYDFDLYIKYSWNKTLINCVHENIKMRLYYTRRIMYIIYSKTTKWCRASRFWFQDGTFGRS